MNSVDPATSEDQAARRIGADLIAAISVGLVILAGAVIAQRFADRPRPA